MIQFLCPTCERLAGFTHRMDGNTLVLKCAKCGKESPVASERAAALPPTPLPRAAEGSSTDSFTVPADRCPKCVAPRPATAATCAQCGAIFANVQSTDYRPEDPTASEWIALAAQWNDPSAHDRFLSGVASRGQLAAAGRLYRIRLARVPEDPMALRGRDEVLRLATVTPSLSRPPPAETRRLNVRTLAVVVMGAVVLLLMVLLVKQIASLRM